MKRIALAAVITAATVTVTACTPTEIEAARAWIAAHPEPTTCHAAVDRYWPASSRSWFHGVVQRESHGIATAKNKRSTASGCGQLLVGHSARFRKLGYTWEHDRFNAVANIRVCLDLYKEVGASPWRIA